MFTLQDTASVQSVEASGVPDWLGPALKFVFSWIVLMSIAVIVSGKLLASRFRLGSHTRQKFRIPIPGVLNVEASGDEVIFGFVGFFITFLFIGLLGGPRAYEILVRQLGIDPGQFNALCMLSSFATVLWTTVLYLFGTRWSHKHAREHAAVIQTLAQGGPVTNLG